MSSANSDSNSISDRPLWIALGINAAAILAGIVVVPLFLRNWFDDTASALWVGVLAPSIAVWSVVGLIGIGRVLWDAVWIIGLDGVHPDEESSPDEELSPSNFDESRETSVAGA